MSSEAGNGQGKGQKQGQRRKKSGWKPQYDHPVLEWQDLGVKIHFPKDCLGLVARIRHAILTGEIPEVDFERHIRFDSRTLGSGTLTLKEAAQLLAQFAPKRSGATAPGEADVHISWDNDKGCVVVKDPNRDTPVYWWWKLEQGLMPIPLQALLGIHMKKFKIPEDTVKGVVLTLFGENAYKTGLVTKEEVAAYLPAQAGEPQEPVPAGAASTTEDPAPPAEGKGRKTR